MDSPGLHPGLFIRLGAQFQRAVGLMYDTESPPKRRIYANGYYSDWFEVKSGVAQGCPLSALLFLVVAEGLRISLEMESGFNSPSAGRQLRLRRARFDSHSYQVDGHLRPRVEGAG